MPLVIYNFNDTYNSDKNIFSIIDSNSHKTKNIKHKIITRYDIQIKIYILSAYKRYLLILIKMLMLLILRFIEY